MGPAMKQRAHIRRRGLERGFTLLELLVVLLILGLLATIAAPQVLKYLGGAKFDTARLQVQSLSTNLDLLKLDMGRYPSQEEGLRALVDRPASAERWNGPYVRRQDSLVDPWGVPYGYRFPGQHGEFDLYSLGADKAEGGEGENRDVTNW
jgi:general secretion pathway protein G